MTRVSVTKVSVIKVTLKRVKASERVGGRGTENEGESRRVRVRARKRGRGRGRGRGFVRPGARVRSNRSEESEAEGSCRSSTCVPLSQ